MSKQVFFMTVRTTIMEKMFEHSKLLETTYPLFSCLLAMLVPDLLSAVMVLSSSLIHRVGMDRGKAEDAWFLISRVI